MENEPNSGRFDDDVSTNDAALASPDKDGKYPVIKTTGTGNNYNNNGRKSSQEMIKTTHANTANQKSRMLQQSDSDTESEGSVYFDPSSEIEPVGTQRTAQTYLLPTSNSQPVINQPSSLRKSSGITRDVRHKAADVHAGAHGQQESSSLLVDVPIHDSSDFEDEISLSWQSSKRSMREQLMRDGYNLDLESDNEDLDLIPPKQNYGAGGICSCSGDSCSIS